MLSLFRKMLLHVLVFGFSSPVFRQNITVKLVVHGTDDRLTERIRNDVKTDLGNKSNIAIVSDTTDSSTFSITIQYATLKTGDKLNGFFINSLLTRRIRTSKNETAYILLKSGVSSSANVSDIEKICSGLIDQYDGQYFEKERRREAAESDN